MKFTIHYLPLSKIKPDISGKLTQHIKKFQGFMWDCMHIIAVRRNKKEGNYIIVSGQDRYEYLQKHTNKKYVPCIIDESNTSKGVQKFIKELRNHAIHSELSKTISDHFVPKSWSIIRAYLKEEARFKSLTRREQLKVLLIALRYKKTVVSLMKMKTDEYLHL